MAEIKENPVRQESDWCRSDVCHILNPADLARAYCGATEQAWADCPEDTYIITGAPYCKCGKPLCQTCETIDQLNQNLYKGTT